MKWNSATALQARLDSWKRKFWSLAGTLPVSAESSKVDQFYSVAQQLPARQEIQLKLSDIFCWAISEEQINNKQAQQSLTTNSRDARCLDNPMMIPKGRISITAHNAGHHNPNFFAICSTTTKRLIYRPIVTKFDRVTNTHCLPNSAAFKAARPPEPKLYHYCNVRAQDAHYEIW